MSGHSKWATTKHKKAVVDARRGKMFARLIKNIEVAARVGGGDPAGNPTLYDAIQKAKKSSVPNENIERARKRGAGEEAGGADWQNITYEGYGPNGVAVLIECLTDNRNRAASEVRVAMTRNGGTMADPGSVAYLFARKGIVILEKDGLSEDDVLTAVLEAGAEEVNDLGDSFEIVSEPSDLVTVRSALQDAGIDYDSADAGFQPSVTVPLDAEGSRKIMKLVDALEDSDDVQDVYTNADIPDDILEQIEADRTGIAGCFRPACRCATVSGQPARVLSNNCSAPGGGAVACHGSRPRTDPVRAVTHRGHRRQAGGRPRRRRGAHAHRHATAPPAAGHQ